MKSIREILTGLPLVSLPGTASVLDAVKKMNEASVGAVLVTDKSGPVGVFTERDLMTRVVEPGLDGETTALVKVMTKKLFTVEPDRRINEVAREMQERHIRHLPVVDDGEIVAMLSLRDLLREHLAIKRQEVQELTAYIQGEGEAPAS